MKLKKITSIIIITFLFSITSCNKNRKIIEQTTDMLSSNIWTMYETSFLYENEEFEISFMYVDTNSCDTNSRYVFNKSGYFIYTSGCSSVIDTSYYIIDENIPDIIRTYTYKKGEEQKKEALMMYKINKLTADSLTLRILYPDSLDVENGILLKYKSIY